MKCNNMESHSLVYATATERGNIMRFSHIEAHCRWHQQASIDVLCYRTNQSGEDHGDISIVNFHSSCSGCFDNCVLLSQRSSLLNSVQVDHQIFEAGKVVDWKEVVNVRQSGLHTACERFVCG